MENRIQTALEVMVAMAGHLMVAQGVAVILELNEEDREGLQFFTPSSLAISPFRSPDPERRGADDKGTSYFPIACSKITEMIRTGQPSGRDPNPPKGEFGYRGGVLALKDGVYTFAAFSGGDQNEDVIIALQGLRALGLTDYVIK